MRIKFTILTLVAALSLAGCNNMTRTERDTATGAGFGAAAGAIIGHQSGHGAGGAVIGAIVGAAAANAWSTNMERQRVEMQRATRGTGIIVTRTNDNRLKLYIPSDISFPPGRSDISPKFSRFLDNFAASLTATRIRALRSPDTPMPQVQMKSICRSRVTAPCVPATI